MSDQPSQLSDSATDVTITYQSSLDDLSSTPATASSQRDRPGHAFSGEDVRIADLPERMIDVGEIIGKGGMGIVRIGRQHLPERDVAVKRLHYDKARLARALLDEAMIMGGLEHPNIVPVHLVRLTDDNSPEVVMKYIQGKAWNEILNKQPQRSEYLLDAIEVLRSICRAVEFAHSRGVIHRDIKPHNVMLGRFGEVYLMDWGIAIRTTDIDRVPAGLVGTPGYMAPEMLSGEPGDVTFQTDVFLLGATLHAILTGERRHRANSVVAALDAVSRVESYSYPPDVPEALANIANCACSANASERFQSVAEFRDALEQYLSLREAFMVRDRAYDKTRQFYALSAEKARKEEHNTQVRQRFAEARFGLEQALQMASNCEGATDELQRLMTAMVKWLLKGGHLDEAAHLYSALPHRDSSLEEEVAAQREATKREKAELSYLKQLAPDYDPEQSQKGRIIFGIAITAVVTCMLTGVLFYDTFNPQDITPLRLVFSTGTVALIVCITVFFNRRWMLTTAIGRRLLQTIVLGFVAAPLLAIASIAADYSANAVMLADTLFIALTMAGAYPIIRSAGIAASFAAINVAIAAIYPDWAHNGLMITTAISALSLVYDWVFRPRAELRRTENS